MKLIGKILLFLVVCGQSQGQSNEWPVFRGSNDLSGATSFEFPSSPQLLWSLPTGAGTKSSPVISEGIVFFGNDKGTIYAVSADGRIRWKRKQEAQ